MDRRRYTREFKVEAVKLVRERGVAVKQAARDLNLHPNVLHRWLKDFAADPQHEPVGQRVGQCGDGELLLLAQDRTHGAQNLPHAR